MRHVLMAIGCFWATQLPAADWTVQVEWQGRRLEGKPLQFSSSQVLLLARDGQLWDLKPNEVANFRETSPQFRPFSQGEMRGQLVAEFGNRFQVSGTGNYLVVHPTGQRDLWAPRFEEIYRAFVSYFSTRGLQPRTPQFPLVAVVFPNQADFQRYARENNAQLAPGIVGYYSPLNNRIFLYDQGQAWESSAATIIHEAVHQIAFNSGIHSRFAHPPRWVAEGLGMLFEAPGVWNARVHPRASDRVNGPRRDFFQRGQAGRKKGWLAEFVASDRAFQSDLGAAYAQAWAVTYFLSETEPRKYAEYLGVTAKRADFSEYRGPERVRDFTRVFGEDWQMLETRLHRFVEGPR